MPIHDWTRVRANQFHHFHQVWLVELVNALNDGVLPEGFYALAEQITNGPQPDVVALSLPRVPLPSGEGAVCLADAPVNAHHQVKAEMDRYADKADRVVIHHPDGDVVAIVEIVSPGNKSSAYAMKAFARKVVRFLRAGVHLLIVDLFPPSKRNPQGIHKVIWDRIEEQPFVLPEGKPLTLAAYSAEDLIHAYVEPIAVGQALASMPIFLTGDRYVLCPLESTYQAAWKRFPKALKGPLEEVRP